ncbi:MAG: O-antigen ligase family protein [Bacteroidales bacterium]|nr:O-antigen ligase family protein [Bacteroidales bacterium]
MKENRKRTDKPHPVVAIPLWLYNLLVTYQQYVFFFFLFMMAVCLPLSRFGLSFAQFGLLGIWIISGKLDKKFATFFRNPAAIVLVSFYLLHIIGLLYSSDMNYAMKDIRVKLPLLFLPVLFSSVDYIDRKWLDRLLKVFLAAVFISTSYSFYIYLTRVISDFRDVSPLVSHIRLSLNVCFAFFIANWFLLKSARKNVWQLVLYLFASLWFLSALLMMESVLAIFIIFITYLGYGIYKLFKTKNRKLKIPVFLLLVLPVAAIVYLLVGSYNNYFTTKTRDFKNLDTHTPWGNSYVNDTTSSMVENGEFIYIYISFDELRDEWNKRSEVDFDSLDRKGQLLRGTLIRYMNSKGLRKDGSGFQKLTENDIRNVEAGIANIEYAKKYSLKSRLYKLFWEYQAYQRGSGPGGNTILQRFEYWRVAVLIIQDHFWTGVGTGDVPDAFSQKYVEVDSPLPMELRFRSHNQYLSIAVAFGIFGLFWFLFSLIYPMIRQRKYSDFIYVSFLITLLISMLVEDTLETQMGVTLFAFFNALLLFAPKTKVNENL